MTLRAKNAFPTASFPPHLSTARRFNTCHAPRDLPGPATGSDVPAPARLDWLPAGFDHLLSVLPQVYRTMEINGTFEYIIYIYIERFVSLRL